KDAGGQPYTSKDFNEKVEGLGFSVPNTPKDTDKNKAEWDKLIAQLQTKLDTVGANIQTQMVQLQDFMGQYNSYMQGANTAISQSNQVLAGLAKGQ
ncbi:MAG: USH1C-binding protein 1, partial [Desulfovibrio sp.]|nr:USH1C-binding protein 1 [Desulfovibrio sp.]